MTASAPGTAPPPVLHLDADSVATVSFDDAADAVTEALTAGLDPAADLPRVAVPVTAGQLLVMPGEFGGCAGVKVVGVAPGNPAAGRPRIQGNYLLLDGATLSPLAVLDGAALTTLRTPAVSAAAARLLSPPDPRRLVVFGSGPQAAGHIRALAAVLPLAEVSVVGRSAERADALAAAVRDEHRLDAHVGTANDVEYADVVVCATTAVLPLFSADSAPPYALVIAVGSHEPEVLELQPALMARSQVVVEDPATALREAGEVVSAVASGGLDPADLVGLSEIVTGAAAADYGRTRVFKSVGMGWEDLVVAVRVFTRARERGGHDDRG